MAEPFTPEQLTQIRELLETIPLAATLLEVARLLGFETWEPGDQAAESLDFLIQSEADTQGLVRDLHTPNRPWITALIASVAAIKAKTDAHLPVPAYPTAPSSGVNAAAVWDTVIGNHPQSSANVTARQLLRGAGVVGLLNQIFGVQPVNSNDDFALCNFIDSRWLPAFNTYNPGAINPRARPAGETVIAYLQRVQPSAGWYVNGQVCIRDLVSPGGGIVASIICTLRDQDERQHPAHPVVPADPALADASRRLKQYLPLPGEGAAGAGVALTGEGMAAIASTTAQITIELTGALPEWARSQDSFPYYTTLGIAAFLRAGEFEAGTALHREANWLRVPPGATAVWWWLRPGVTGVLTPIAAAP